MRHIRKLIKNLPTLLTALVFAIAVWSFAVTQADPTEVRIYPRPVPIEVVGLEPEMVIVNDIPQQVTLTIRAPLSVHARLENDINLIDVTLDMTGLEQGSHTINPQVDIAISPTEVVRISPSSIVVVLDSILSEPFEIQLDLVGSPAIGYETQTPVMSVENALVSGSQSLIESIDQVIAQINIQDASEDISQLIPLQALDSEGMEVTGVTITPEMVQVTVPISQRGGFRTVVVKIVTSGQIAPGYRLTNIFAMPATVTIFSSDPNLVEGIPGFVETTPINLNGVSEDFEVRVGLNLPQGINVVGSQNVTVQIGIDPIQGSLNFTNLEIQVEGLDEDYTVELSPENVDVFLSGPLPILDQLSPEDIQVVLDLTGRTPGTYQLAPNVRLTYNELSIDAIIPSSIEVTITEVNGN